MLLQLLVDSIGGTAVDMDNGVSTMLASMDKDADGRLSAKELDAYRTQLGLFIYPAHMQVPMLLYSSMDVPCELYRSTIDGRGGGRLDCGCDDVTSVCRSIPQ